MGRFLIDKSASGVDPALLGWIEQAAAASPYDVRFQSGKREGDPRFHGKGMATDVQLIEPKTGKVIPNYQTPESFKAYQDFANTVHGVAGNDPRLRWGGYFSGGKGKYGAFDLMHFDLGGQQVPMGGGSWDTGLTQSQASLWGLQPGGGAPAGGGSVGSTLASAVDPRGALMAQMENNPWKSITDTAPRRGGLVGEGSAGGGLSAPPNADPGIPPLETASANAMPDPLAADPLAAQPGSMTSQLGSLAKLFKVRPIGQTAQAQGLPVKRAP